MSGHTPGPWVAMNGTDVFTELSAKNFAGVLSAHNDGWCIADCSMGDTSTEDGGMEMLSQQEKAANARLISAAPELLEALLIADAMLSGANMNANVVQKKVKAAIAKATGEGQ